MTREQWAERPMAERKVAAQAWCDGWMAACRTDVRDAKLTLEAPCVVCDFALALPDAPAQDDRVAIVAAVIQQDSWHEGRYLKSAEASIEWAQGLLRGIDSALAKRHKEVR